ncbi:MAG: hypothetical protein QW753_02980 [Thermofilum sp.]
MPFSGGDGSSKWQEKLEEISREILSALRKIDENIEKHTINHELHGLQPIPRFSTVLYYESLAKDKMGYDLRYTKYDYFPVLLSDLGIVRSIRFSGKVDKIDIDNSFIVKKMNKSREDGRRIAERLSGVFITYGKIKNMNLSTLQMFAGAVMGLLRPYAKILQPNVHAVVPSPLSLSAYEYRAGENLRRVWLSPSSVTVHLSRGIAEKRENQVLGRKIRYAIAEGYMVSGKPRGGGASYVKVGPFPVVFPLSEDFREDLIHIVDKLRKHDVIAHLVGIFVFEGEPYLLSGQGQPARGYFLSLSEFPIPLDVEIIAMVGEPWELDLGGKPFRRKLYPALCVYGKKIFESARRDFLKTLRSIRMSSGAEDLIESQVIGSSLALFDEFFWDIEDMKCYLSPPLITMALMESIPVEKIYESVFKAIGQIRLMQNLAEDLRIYSVSREDDVFRKVFEKRKLMDVWAEAYRVHVKIAKDLGLGYVM